VPERTATVPERTAHQLVAEGELEAVKIATAGFERQRWLVFERSEVERCLHFNLDVDRRPAPVRALRWALVMVYH